MSEFTTLMARDGHEFQRLACRARRAGRAAPIVVVQEIFGVNSHIRARHRRLRGRRLSSPSHRRSSTACAAASSLATPRRTAGRSGVREAAEAATQVLADVAAAIAVVRNSGRVGIVGYCWGGKVAYLAACDLQCRLRGLLLRRQHHERADQAAEVRGDVSLRRARQAHPAERHRENQGRASAGRVLPLPADHGFNCDQRDSYDPASAALARERSLAFFAKHLARTRGVNERWN